MKSFTSFSPGASAQGSSTHADKNVAAAVESHGNMSATVGFRGSADNPATGAFAAAS